MAEVKGYGVMFREPGKLLVEELTFLAPGPGQIRMKVHACGLCRSDVSVFTGKLPSMPGFKGVVLGHEGAGIVESVGPEVRDLAVGDCVILNLVSPCGRCQACSQGRPSLCQNKAQASRMVKDRDGGDLDVMAGLGCMAEYAVVSQQACVKVGADVPLEKGALISCGVTTGAGAAMNRAKVQPGSSCCVIGCGGVGLSAIQGARICGARQIIAVDTAPSKLKAAMRFGATHVVNASEKTVTKEVRALSGGGADVSIEAIGLPVTADQAIRVVRPGGMAVLVGIGKMTDMVTMPMNLPLGGEINITGSFMGSSVPSVYVPTLVDLYKKGDLLIDEMISRFYKVQDAQAAFDELESGDNLRGVIVMHDLEKLAAASASGSRL